MGGNYKLFGKYKLSSAQSGLVISSVLGKNSITIPWKELIEVESGSEADLRSRVTVSRALLLGVFALGVKKEKKKTEEHRRRW